MKAFLFFCFSIFVTQAHAMMVEGNSRCTISSTAPAPQRQAQTRTPRATNNRNQARRAVQNDTNITCDVLNGETPITGANARTVIPLLGERGGTAMQRLPQVLTDCRIARTPPSGAIRTFVIRGATEHRCFRTNLESKMGSAVYNSAGNTQFRNSVNTMVERSSIDMATANGEEGEGLFQIQSEP